MGFFGFIPLLIFPTILYAMFAFSNGSEGMTAGLASKAFSMKMASGGEWVLTWGGLLIIVSIICLYIEVIKSARATKTAMVDNALSVGLFVICLILFILVPGFATTEFFLLMMMALLDFMAGMVVMVTTAQRTVTFGGDGNQS